MVFDWANDPDVRAASFQTAQISIEEHESWFNEVLDRLDQHLLIVERVRDGVPVGQFRLDEATGEVSVSVCSGFRHQGLGASVIRAGVSEMALRVRPGRMVAKIRSENAASIRSFEESGFSLTGHAERDGIDFLIYEWNPSSG